MIIYVLQVITIGGLMFNVIWLGLQCQKNLLSSTHIEKYDFLASHFQ